MALARLHLPLSLGQILAFLFRLVLPGLGPDGMIARFEKGFAARFGRKNAIAFCRARTGFYHLLQCLDLAKGSEIIISGLHVADFVNMILLAGFKPVVVDMETDGFGIDMADLEAKTTPRSAALLVTPLSGHCLNMRDLADFAAKRGLVLIEDCSQAFSASLDGKPVGSFGRAALYSLSLLKSISTIRGGMVTTDDAALAAKLRARAQMAGAYSRPSLAMEAVKQAIIAIATWRPIFSLLVLPLLRLTSSLGDLFGRFQKSNKTVILRSSMPPSLLEAFSWQQAVLGLQQLASFDSREAKRVRLAIRLRAQIRPDARISLPCLVEGSRNSWWLFPLLVENAAALRSFLAKQGIDSAPMLLSAISSEPAFAEMGFTAPMAERLRARTVFVPLHDAMDEEDVDRQAAALAAFLAQPLATRTA